MHTSVAGISGAIAQPKILRECKSSTAARYSQPLRVRMWVMLLTQARLGRGLSNWRASTLGDPGMRCLLSMVATCLRFYTERSPLAHIELRTLWRPIVTPFMCSAVRSLRLP